MWTQRLSSCAFVAGLLLAATYARAEPAPETTGSAEEDQLASYREQFKRGMDRYKAGALADAIGYWEPIYRELGQQNGYRLAYNLGIAYQELGDATHAAERFQAFLAEVDGRREHGESLAPIVEKEEGDARTRVAGLVATKGRIAVAAASSPQSARVDANEPRLAGFIAWVTPGDHTVTFAAGTPDMETKSVHVRAGEIVDIAPRPPPPPAPPEPVIVTVPAPAPRPEIVTRRVTRHPFPWPVMAVSGGIAAASGIAAVPLYGNAWALHNSGTDPQSFHEARTWAYSVLGGAIGFTAVTAGLAAWYFLGSSEREVVITPAISAGPGSSSLLLTGCF